MARTRAVVVATVAAASVLGASVRGWWLGGLARAAQPVARVVEVIDGDTVTLAAADGFRLAVRTLSQESSVVLDGTVMAKLKPDPANFTSIATGLAAGEHTIHFGAVFRFTLAEDGFDAELPIDMTYHLTVE
jgi:hypothetical protein